MSINKEFLGRDSNITVKVLKDSISDKRKRLISYELEFPRYIHCFDDKTEVLARVGDSNPEFMLFKKAMVLSAEVAQYNPETEEITFVKPYKYIENSGSHKMISMSTRKFELSVTDKHRVLVDKRTTGNRYVQEVWEADSFLGDYFGCRLRQSGRYLGKQIYSKEELALMVWFASDGALSGNQVCFHLGKERKKKSIVSLLEYLGIEYSFSQYKDSFSIRFESPSWVYDCYTEDGFKKLPKNSLYMNMESYNFVKAAILESDGSVKNQDFNNCSKVYAEQIQILAHLHNDSMNLRYYDKGGNASRLYKSSFKTTNYISLRRDNDVFSSEVVNCKVYCVSVPDKFIMVRRGGIVHISGNCELLTHRMLSKNCSSSRAIPIKKMLGYIEDNMAVPVYLGKNRGGMKADEEIQDKDEALSVWRGGYEKVKGTVNTLVELGVHKQTANRLTESYQMMKVVVTATDWDNFWNLRFHKDAQPEFVMLVHKMYLAMQESTPVELHSGEWHLPYVEICQGESPEDTYYFYYDEDKSTTETGEYLFEKRLTLDEALKRSTASCASVSYRTEALTDKAVANIYNMLVQAKVVHSSPLEHQGTPMQESIWTMAGFENVNLVDNAETWEDGITHMRRSGDLCSGNLTGFIQYRHLIQNNTCEDFDFDERYAEFL